MVMFDVDHFKKINDTYGHPAGDYVLSRISAKVNETVRAEDRPELLAELCSLAPEQIVAHSDLALRMVTVDREDYRQMNEAHAAAAEAEPELVVEQRVQIDAQYSLARLYDRPSEEHCRLHERRDERKVPFGPA